MVLIGRPGYRVAAEVDLNQVLSGLQRRRIASRYEGGFSVHRIDDDRELLARGAPHSALDQRVGLVVRSPGGAGRYQRHGEQANDCLRTRHDMPPELGKATRELYAPGKGDSFSAVHHDLALFGYCNRKSAVGILRPLLEIVCNQTE